MSKEEYDLNITEMKKTLREDLKNRGISECSINEMLGKMLVIKTLLDKYIYKESLLLSLLEDRKMY